LLNDIDSNIEQESESKSRVRALTRDPTRPGPKLLTRWPVTRRPGSISASCKWWREEQNIL